jgi:RNA polymerase sigma factor (sigma-70 family)
MSDGGLRPPRASTDAELAVRLRSGDADGFRELYVRHACAIHDFLARVVRDASAAEDLTSSTFQRAWERRETLRDPVRVRPWLFAIAHRLGTGHRRRNRSADPIDAAAGAEIEDTGRGPEEAEVAQELADLAWAAASSLGPRQYAVLDLSVRQELCSREIADALDVPVARAWVLVHRAREALGNAVRDLLVAQQRDQCAQIAMLVPGGVGVLTSQQRCRVDHHMRQCANCRVLALRLTNPAELLPWLTPFPLPASLADGPAGALAGISARRGAAAAASGGGAPRPRVMEAITAAAALALLLLVGAAYLFRPVGAAVPAPAVAAAPPGPTAPQLTPMPVATSELAPSLPPGTPASPPSPAGHPSGPALPRAPAPTVNLTAAPTPIPAPAFAVLTAAVQNNARCQPESVLSARFVCSFTVRIQVVNAAGGESVAGTLTATDSLSGSSAGASFRAQVTSPGASTLSVRVTVRFAGCPQGTASVTTQPAGSTAGPIRFGDCGLL